MADAKTEKQKESTVSREETVSKPVIHKNSQTVSAENAAAKGSEQQLLSGDTDKKAVAVDSKKRDQRSGRADRGIKQANGSFGQSLHNYNFSADILF